MNKQVYEFGLDKKWADEFNVTKVENVEVKPKKDIFLFILGSLITIGCSLSIIIFFLEIAWHLHLQKVHLDVSL